MLDRRVGPRTEQRFVTVDAPADEPRWGSLLTVDGDDLTPSLGRTDMTAPNDDPITNSCLHGDHLLDALKVPSLAAICSISPDPEWSGRRTLG
jgi:hypothetical protein